MCRVKYCAMHCDTAPLPFSTITCAGSARDYLNAPIDSGLNLYNTGYSTSFTPEDRLDITSGTRSNVLVRSIVITRTMDYWGRTGGLSIVLPYAFVEISSGSFQASINGFSDVGFLWRMNISGGPALTRDQFQSFVPETVSSFHLCVERRSPRMTPRSRLIQALTAGRSVPPSITATRPTEGGVA